MDKKVIIEYEFTQNSEFRLSKVFEIIVGNIPRYLKEREKLATKGKD